MPFLTDEIREQPEALARLLERQAGRIADAVPHLRQRDPRFVVLAARGSSDNAARYGQYVLGAYNRLPVALATPSLFSLYHTPPRLGGALVVGVSQSGRSPDIVAVLVEAAAQGCPTLAITNQPSSPLAQAADLVLPLEAGEERAVAATKTYVNSLGALALLSCALDDDQSRLGELRAVPEAIAGALDDLPGRMDRLGDLSGAQHCPVIARGFNYATAFETALKIREMTGIAAEAFSAADLLHGPIAAVADGSPVVVVAPSGVPSASLGDLLDQLAQRGARRVVVSDDSHLLDRAEVALPLRPGVPEWLSPMVAVVPGQLVAVELARLRGIDLDQPPGLTKVTETR